MKIAFSNLACPEWPVEMVMARAAEYGYDGVELRLLNGEVIPSRPDGRVCRQIRDSAQAHGVEVIGIGASTRFAMTDAHERKRQEDELTAYLELAAELCVPFVRTFGGTFPADATDCIGWVAESLNRLAERAGALGVDILLETHDDFSSSRYVRDVLAQVPSPRIGALWDIHHPVRMGESAEETYQNLAERLRHIHIKDARRTPTGWDLVLLGAGEIPVEDILQRVRAGGYDAYLSVEWERKWHPEIQPAEVALPQHIAVLRQLLASL